MQVSTASLKPSLIYSKKIKNQSNSATLTMQTNDVCQFSSRATKPISVIAFKGLNKLCSSDLEMKILDGVNPEFAKKIEFLIKKFPNKLLKELKDANFKVIVSNSLTDAYASEHINDFKVFKNEFINPKGTYAVTYYQGHKKNNFFVFADKSVSDKYLPGIVNHELSHGIEGIKDLAKNKEMLSAIKNDVKLIVTNRKLDSLSSTDRQIASKYFFGKDAENPMSEIITDTLAWKLPGGGCYGSGIIADETNKSLIPGLFPTLYSKLNELL